MAPSFDLVTIDAVDSEHLARFWSEALQLTECEREDNGRWIVLGSVSVDSDTGAEVRGPTIRRIGIQRIPGLGASGAHLEGPGKSRIHLDLRCGPEEFPAEVERLCRLGATQLGPERHESYGSIANLCDPEGNVFDLCAYKAIPGPCELG